MDYAVTVTEKEILKAFHMTSANVRAQTAEINEYLIKIGIRAMGRSISIDEKIETQKDQVSKEKDRYEAKLDKLEKMMRKRDELRSKELLEAFTRFFRNY